MNDMRISIAYIARFYCGFCRAENTALSNDFMFCRVMSSSDVCAELIRRLLHIPQVTCAPRSAGSAGIPQESSPQSA